MPSQTTLHSEDWLWLLGSLCRLSRVPFDAQLVSQQFPPPHSSLTLREAVHALGFRTGERSAASVHPSELTYPCIAFLRARDRGLEPSEAESGSAALERSGRPHLHLVEPGRDAATVQAAQPALLLHFDGTKLLYIRAGGDATESIDAQDIATTFEPTLIFVVHEPANDTAVAAEDSKSAKPPFGFRWFIPELLRHKRIWRDVLLASVSIQLVGLAVPLFTQVIVDKVVVHQTQSTLIVIGVALVMFMVFTSGMTWLRQYLVLHTGNRVDAVLGSQIFRHLLRLPLPFFEQRTTGVLVARLQGVETIRQFVSGAAVSLLLDLPFLLMFLAVMFFYSWQLSLIALGLLGVIAIMSVAVVPLFRAKLNQQFLLGARNQSFVTEYVSGIATVKSLQMEPYLERKYGDNLAAYLSAGFSTKRIANTYNVVANGIEQAMTLSI